MAEAMVKIVSQGVVHEVPKEVASALPKPSQTASSSEDKASKSVSNATKFLFQYGRKQKFSEGHYLIREGNSDKTVYIIIDGEVEVLKKDKHGNDIVVTKLSGGGTILGEMSIFLDERRSSSVRISKPSMILEFTGDNFLKAVVNIPELSMRILKSLSNKVKNSNETIVHGGNDCNTCKHKKKAQAKSSSNE